MEFIAPRGYQSIYNPSIPYVGPINGGLRAGMSIYIQGMMHHHISRFHVNLQCGEFDGCDIAFHFNPRIQFWDKVIFNTFQNGTWEGEEKVHEMPFHKGRHFEMVVVVNSEGYQVNVNGRDFYLFQHRMPVERVCALEIGGDVVIDTINIIGGGSMAYPGGNLPVSDIPYSDMIPGGMTFKRTIIIRGMVPYGADRFGINFMVGASQDIAFHINPRIQEGLVIRNSLINGIWGEEESVINSQSLTLSFPHSQISIRCGEEKFKVFVNGQHLCHFFHRFQPYNQIDMLEVKGDVQLSYIHY
uniref:Galectin n=1 Tax=Electrophorus electricus TaxID=8005 RepID=A0A4W4FK14_ELEEL